MAVGAALAGDEAQQQALVHADGLGRSQILGHEDAGLSTLQAGVVHALQDVQHGLCDIDDVRTAGLQIRVIHGGEHSSLIIAGSLDGVLGALVLAVDDLLDGVHKVVIFQHHGMDVEHLGDILAGFCQSLLVQSGLLLDGLLLGVLKAGHLCSGICYIGGGNGGVFFLVDLELTDGDAIQDALTGAYLHCTFSFFTGRAAFARLLKKSPRSLPARASLISAADQTFSVRNF